MYKGTMKIIISKNNYYGTEYKIVKNLTFTGETIDDVMRQICNARSKRTTKVIKEKIEIEKIENESCANASS